MNPVKILTLTLFVMMFGLCPPATALGRQDFNSAMIHQKLSGTKVLKPYTAEAHRVTANQLRGSRKASAFLHGVQTNAGPIAPWPYADFMRLGLEEGKVLYGVFGEAQFVPESAIRVYVDGRLTDKKFRAQEYETADPASPHELYTFGVVEFSTIVRVPATLGSHSIELQIPWKDGNWFPLVFEDVLEPEVAFLGSCATEGATDAEDEVTSYFAYVTLDGKFPAVPLFFVNDIELVPTKPLVYETVDEYVTVLAVTYSAKNYADLKKSAEGNEELRFRIEGVQGELTFEWAEYGTLPAFEELEHCNSCHDPETGEEIPCEVDGMRRPVAK